MRCKGFAKRIIPFVVTLSAGLLTVAILRMMNPADKIQPEPVNKVVYANEGRGTSGGCKGTDDYEAIQEKPSLISHLKKENVRILSKPRAAYTADARVNFTQGKVVLRVTFSANGQIGAISTISGLPDGLTEQAVAAAKRIKFEPAMRDGVPVSVTKPVEYTFTIY